MGGQRQRSCWAIGARSSTVSFFDSGATALPKRRTKAKEKVMTTKKVMITGVYGLIAGAIYNHLVQYPQKYDVYGLARRRRDSDRVAPERTLNVPDDKFFLSDLSNLEEVVRAFSGIDAVVHMAADASGQAGFQSVLKSNLIGGYHAFEACRQAGVKRIIFASSIQVSSGYGREEPYSRVSRGEYDGEPQPIVTHTMPTRR